MKIVIIGGGPAGLTTGLKLLEQEIKPVILEKQSEITSTVCAEACDLHSLKQIPFDSSPYVSKEVKGLKLFFPGNYSFLYNIKGVVLDRSRWLKGMADEFTKGEGVLITGANVETINKNSVFLADGEKIEYDILVGADGPFSVVRKHMGISQELVSGVQYKIKCDTSDMNYLEFHFDKRFSPQYSWVFPKENSVNVGIIGKFRQLDSFLDSLKLKKDIQKKEAGVIPMSGIPQKIVEEKMALIGDAASITNPLSGGGLTPIIYASRILSNNIYDLKKYEKELKNHPMSHPSILRAKNVLLKAKNSELGILGEIFDGKVLEKVSFSDYLRILRHPLLISKISSVGKGVSMALRWGW